MSANLYRNISEVNVFKFIDKIISIIKLVFIYLHL